MLNEAQILLNNEIKVTSPRSQWFGHIGIVNKIMADGRTLEVRLNSPANHDVVFIDASLVSEIQEPAAHSKSEPNLGPDGNSVLPRNQI
tara:strand:- start:335 stop:601 length:267 start_codon:yes stop_codon:yes gene_type:complete